MTKEKYLGIRKREARTYGAFKAFQLASDQYIAILEEQIERLLNELKNKNDNK